LGGGTLYGLTEQGGNTNNEGTLFRVNTNGTGYQVLLPFSGLPDGANPTDRLLLAGGYLYGTATIGSTVSGEDWGTVFRVDTNGANFGVL